ncbi:MULTISPECIES: LacI family DNA-binding transcriptional regulator [unclassified Knoellia]|uniref:LacI family DNA-binding transcriptional regulator n=1 Tax=Knoellia altitudinis TaxID=3404795 RepID=UPI003610372A
MRAVRLDESEVGVGRVTLQTVADRVGVSRMTVSNAFSRPDQLSSALRDKVLKAAEELGYTGPDPSARALARGSTGSVGVLLSNSPAEAFTDEVAAAFFSSIAATLSPRGIALTLLSSEPSGDVMPARDVAMDGVIVYNCDPESGAREQVERRKLPLVLVDQPNTRGFSSVNVEDRSGARAAAQHVVDLGHSRVALIGKTGVPPFGIVESSSAKGQGYASTERLAGWIEVLTEAGIEPVILQEPIDSTAGGRGALKAILEVQPDTTAILAFSDAMAAGVLLDAHDAGISVPDQLSVVGFDDNPLATRLRPQLTTVRQDVTEKGRLAASMLVEAMADRRAGRPTEPRAVTLTTELVVRDSTAPPPRAGKPPEGAKRPQDGKRPRTRRPSARA